MQRMWKKRRERTGGNAAVADVDVGARVDEIELH
jgi:hypothetical protein